MPIPIEALELENRSIGQNGAATLAAAYQILKGEWEAGVREREVALHLLFLAWYGLCEPSHLTGFDEMPAQVTELEHTFNQVYRFIQPTIDSDPELLYVVGVMAHLFPYLLGDAATWIERSKQYRQQYRSLVPTGLDPAIFHGRGAYGDYFAGQAQVVNGY
jgi:hypothetical protein